MEDPSTDILERLKHPENETKRKKSQNNLLIRNALNLVFIILALITMGCIGYYFYTEGETPMWCYFLGIVAVIVKMCESMLRMPWLNKSEGIRTHRRHR